MKYGGKFNAVWVDLDTKNGRYLVPENMVDSNDACPILAEVESSTRRKTARALGLRVFEVIHQGDDDEIYLEMAKGEVIKALRRWGFEIEEMKP